MDQLADGTQLRQYVIREVLGAGGFGITYRAEHATLSARNFAIKEFYPRSMASRDGLDVVPNPKKLEIFAHCRQRCLLEAELLSVCSHPSIVEVIDYFEENNTAYTVLSYVSGKTLNRWLGDLNRLPTQAELDEIIGPLLSALEVIHDNDLLHRDIAPDNIIIRPDGTPCLIDFGAARGTAVETSEATHLIVKSGYSPIEQYQTNKRLMGPWTDIYALAATIHRAVSSKAPPDALARGAGTEFLTLSQSAEAGSFRPGFIAAVERALNVDAKERPKSISEWRTELLADINEVEEPSATDLIGEDAAALAEIDPSVAESPASIEQPMPAPQQDARHRSIKAFNPWTMGAGLLLIAAGTLTLVSQIEWRDKDPVKSIVISDTGASRPAGDQAVRTKPMGQSSGASKPVVAGERDDGRQVEATATSGQGNTKQKEAQLGQRTPEPNSIENVVTANADPAAIAPTGVTAGDPSIEVNLQNCRGRDHVLAIRVCGELLQSSTLNPEERTDVLFRLGVAFRRNSQYEEALKVLSEAISVEPSSVYFNQRGAVFVAQKAFGKAIDDFGRAVFYDPENGEYYNNLAWAKLQHGQPTEALPDATKAVGLLREKAYVWDTRGHINEALGNKSAAIGDFKNALAIDPRNKSSAQGLKRLTE